MENPVITAEIERLRSTSPTSALSREEQDQQRALELTEDMTSLLTRLGEVTPNVEAALDTPWGVMAVAQVAGFTLCHITTEPQFQIIHRHSLNITPIRIRSQNLVEMLALRDPNDFIDPRDYVTFDGHERPVLRSTLPALENQRRLRDLAHEQDRADREKQAQHLRTAFTPSQCELAETPWQEVTYRDALAMHVTGQLGRTLNTAADVVNLTDNLIRALRPS